MKLATMTSGGQHSSHLLVGERRVSSRSRDTTDQRKPLKGGQGKEKQFLRAGAYSQTLCAILK